MCLHHHLLLHLLPVLPILRTTPALVTVQRYIVSPAPPAACLADHVDAIRTIPASPPRPHRPHRPAVQPVVPGGIGLVPQPSAHHPHRTPRHHLHPKDVVGIPMPGVAAAPALLPERVANLTAHRVHAAHSTDVPRHHPYHLVLPPVLPAVP